MLAGLSTFILATHGAIFWDLQPAFPRKNRSRQTSAGRFCISMFTFLFMIKMAVGLRSSVRSGGSVQKIGQNEVALLAPVFINELACSVSRGFWGIFATKTEVGFASRTFSCQGKWNRDPPDRWGRLDVCIFVFVTIKHIYYIVILMELRKKRTSCI